MFKDKNCEKPVKELFFKNNAAKTKTYFLLNFREKLYWEMIKTLKKNWEKLHLFSASFVKNPEAAISGAI